MGRTDYRNRVFIVGLLIITMLVGCSRENKSPNTYCLEDFEEAMSDKGYSFEVEDVDQDFLQTTRKRMIIEDIVIYIYIFNSDEEMESEASNIDSDGSGYTNGSKSLCIDWVSFPHFYKKGSIIVQYIGEDNSITSVLEGVLGEQFAGYN